MDSTDSDSPHSEYSEHSKFHINYKKTKKIDLEEWITETIDASQNSPYKISKLQQYNPIYSKFFELNANNYDSISLNHKYHRCHLPSIQGAFRT